MTTAAEVRDVNVTEADFMQTVIDLAKLNGWLVYHTHDSRRSEPGMPDLALVRPATPTYAGQFLMWECKTEKGIVSAAQIRWIDALKSAGVEVGVVRPRDWETITARLKQRTPHPVDGFRADDDEPLAETLGRLA